MKFDMIRHKIFRNIFIFLLLLLPGIVHAQDVYTVRKGVIYCPAGVPEAPRWFADSRLAFAFDEHGVAQVDYYNPEAKDLSTIFLRQLWDGFRYYVEMNNKTFKPSFQNSQIWPFGVESEWKFENAVFKQRVMAINESIVIQLVMPDSIPPSIHFKLEFFEDFGLTKGSVDDVRFSNGGTTRKWDDWKFFDAANLLTGGVQSRTINRSAGSSEFTSHTYCSIGADFQMDHVVRPINHKHILQSPLLQAGKTYSFLITFGKRQDEANIKNRLLVKSLAESIKHQFERYENVAENSPVLESPYRELNNFISLAPMYHEALKITDIPGALRAKTSNYWVWGWDGMTSNYATAYWNDLDLIKNMLVLYEKTADSLKGIAHAFGNDMKPSSISALPAQGMYITLLQLYYANTGDIKFLQARYPFAKTVFNRIKNSEVGQTGFCEGTSLFPDFPEVMAETGHDLSGFNNTIFYCAARSMESIAALVGDKKERDLSLNIIKRFEKNFIPLFFNREKQFIVSSIDSKSLQQRDSYNTNSIRWENNYCADITDTISQACLQFFKENAVTPMGLREIPVWNKSYDMDANQLHCWWPVTGEYFMRLINRNDEKPLVDQWVKWVSYWTKHLTCPEGISYYIETDEPEFDRWTSQKGTWQAYSMRGWYQAAMHGVVGVGTDAGGITIYPYSGEEMKLTGLNYRNKKFDFEFKGRGKFIESIVVDGNKIIGTNKIPADLYEQKNRVHVIVNRAASNPFLFSISSGTAIKLQHYSYTKQKISATLDGAGLCRLKLVAANKPVVKVKGKKVNVAFNPGLSMATVELNLDPGHLQQIEIYSQKR